MTKLAFILHARDKVKHVRAACRSMLLQDSPRPIEIIFSDQGSTDGTLGILEDEARRYGGPHAVHVVRCPHVDLRGMGGLNAHITWSMGQTDADFILQLSADDYALPRRAILTWEAFEAHKPSMVLTGMYYVREADGAYEGESAWPDASVGDSWCKLEEMFSKYVGGSASQAWTHEFFDKIGGLDGLGSQDVVMPFLACLDKGAWYIYERLHAYRRCVGVENTGLQSVLEAHPKGSPEHLQVEELIHFQVLTGLYDTLAKMDAAGLRTPEAEALLAQNILDRAAGWNAARVRLSLRQIPPLSFKT